MRSRCPDPPDPNLIATALRDLECAIEEVYGSLKIPLSLREASLRIQLRRFVPMRASLTTVAKFF